MLLCFAGCKEQIVHNLSEPELHRVLTRLTEINLTAQREKQADGYWTVAVDTDDALRALQYLEATHTLHKVRESKEKKSNLIASREEQRFAYERSLSEEIEATLLSMDGALDARVHLNLPPTDPLFGQALTKVAASASVLMIVSKDFAVDRSQIAQLIAGASGIDAKLISVILTQQVQEPRVDNKTSENLGSKSSWKYLFAKISGESLMLEIALSLVILGVGGVYLSGIRMGKG